MRNHATGVLEYLIPKVDTMLYCDSVRKYCVSTIGYLNVFHINLVLIKNRKVYEIPKFQSGY